MSNFFFFFKQKTAYEMRISDWSSDVCSSDLAFAGSGRSVSGHLRGSGSGTLAHCGGLRLSLGPRYDEVSPKGKPCRKFRRRKWPGGRSEEHTSELQSLMRISYAVFCLQKTMTPLTLIFTKHTLTTTTPTPRFYCLI